MPDRQRVTGFAVAALATCIVGVLVHKASAWALVLLVGAPTMAVGAGFTVLARRHHRWVNRLSRQCAPRRVAEMEVQVGVVQHGAVVAGLFRPRIYCDSALFDDLSADELRAVALHERGHQRALDPLRLTLLGVAEPLFGHSRRGRHLVERLRAEREILADRYAIRNGAPTRAIASALLKMGGPPPAGVAGFANATELRLRALLGDQIPLPTVTGTWILMGITLGAILCTSSLEPDQEVLALLQRLLY